MNTYHATQPVQVSTWLKLIVVLASLSVPLASSATPKPEMGELKRSNDDRVLQDSGLQTVKHRFFDKLYVNQEIPLGSARKVYIEAAEVSFSKYWEKDHRSDLSRRYKSDTLDRYSKLLGKRITETFEKSARFEVVNRIEEADLLIKPQLNRLNIHAPDDSIHKSLVFRAGSARIDLLVVDARSGAPVLRFVDGRDTNDTSIGRPVSATRVSNTRDFGMLMKKWSARAVEYMEESE